MRWPAILAGAILGNIAALLAVLGIRGHQWAWLPLAALIIIGAACFIWTMRPRDELQDRASVRR